jgi:hypothetical protein
VEEPEDAIRGRLDELGVRISADELQELASAYPALVAWMRMAEELARDEEGELPE